MILKSCYFKPRVSETLSVQISINKVNVSAMMYSNVYIFYYVLFCKAVISILWNPLYDGGDKEV